MEIPELDIKDSKLAEDIIILLQGAKDKFDAAHRMIHIAYRIASRGANETALHLAIERARTPGFALGKREMKRLENLIASAEAQSRKLLGENPRNRDLNDLHGLFRALVETLPKSTKELVFEKLKTGTISESPLRFSPYLARLMLRGTLRKLALIESEIGKHPRIERIRALLKEMARIVRAPEYMLFGR
jgi:hypothetical protein